MKRYPRLIPALSLLSALLVIASVAFITTSCGPLATPDSQQAAKETDIVNSQQAIYAKVQPVPLFNYSLPRDLWIQFYKVSTSNVVRTWSAEVSDYGFPLFMTESIGYPIPMDTQLTNSWMVIDDPYRHTTEGGGQVVSQPEPNGLFTSPNTNATIIMSVDTNGKVAPIYCEHKVLCWPFPVIWNKELNMFERVAGSKSSISLETSGSVK
jgi:hypothetical protein